MLTVRSRTCWNMAAEQRRVVIDVAMDVLRVLCYRYVLYKNFSSTPIWILNLTISWEREFDTEFNGIPCIRKYCQFFTHESIIDHYVSVSVCRHCKVLDENAEQCQKPRQKQPLPLEHVDFYLTHECLGPPHSPPQTASGSNQPFCHNSHVRTDRWGWRMFSTNSVPLAMLIESDALIIQFSV